VIDVNVVNTKGNIFNCSCYGNKRWLNIYFI